MKKVLLTITLCLMMVLSFGGTVFADGNFSIDGSYDEWSNMPHTVITHNPDYWERDGNYSMAAAATKDGYFYCHVYTESDAIISQYKGDQFSAFYLALGDSGAWFMPRFFEVTEDGDTINWENPRPKFNDTTDVGTTHHYYISFLGVENEMSDYTSFGKLKEDGKYFGEAVITISEGRQDVEFRLNIEAMVNNYNKYNNTSLDASTVNSFTISFSRLGNQVVRTEGTPTGMLGVVVCAGVACTSYYFIDKKRKQH